MKQVYLSSASTPPHLHTARLRHTNLWKWPTPTSAPTSPYLVYRLQLPSRPTYLLHLQQQLLHSNPAPAPSIQLMHRLLHSNLEKAASLKPSAGYFTPTPASTLSLKPSAGSLTSTPTPISSLQLKHRLFLSDFRNFTTSIGSFTQFPHRLFYVFL